jgi:hypothetical protein
MPPPPPPPSMKNTKVISQYKNNKSPKPIIRSGLSAISQEELLKAMSKLKKRE